MTLYQVGNQVPEQPWLVRQKVLVPDQVADYVDRPSLAMRCDPMRRRLTAIHAPGGFGKTTLLAAVCRRRQEAGDVVAWLTLDEGDDAKTLATYVGFAFSLAGLEIERMVEGRTEVLHPDDRINAVLEAVEAHGTPCVLALDDVHRLRDPKSDSLLDHLIRHGPPNLHFALSFRHVPTGIDVATPVLGDEGALVTAAELRFDKPDIARFFAGTLAPQELVDLAELSRGWPIALRIHRNTRQRPTSVATVANLAANWVETRLLRGMSRDDRDFVLDVGLLDWLSPDLVDEVFPVGSMRRLRRTPALAGLLQSIGRDSDVMYLHPLVRRYCANHRRTETPERFRSVHRATAEVLARDGKIIVAMRHAAQAQDSRLVGEIVEGAGAAKYWLRNGLTTLEAANQIATPDVRAMFPRVALMHCMALFMFGELEDAVDAYAQVRARTDGLTRDRDGGSDRDLYIEHVVFEYLMAWVGCKAFGTPEMNAVVSRIEQIAEDGEVEPFVRALAGYALGVIRCAKGNPEAATRQLERARTELARSSPYMTMYVDLQLGIVAMCQGRVADARTALERARTAAARGESRRDDGVSLLGEIAAIELERERNGFAGPGDRVPTSLAEYGSNAASLDGFAPGAELAADLALGQGGPAGALKALREVSRFALASGRETLARCVAGQRVSLLAAAGRTEEAQRLWTDSDLPQRLDDLVDLDGQTWREMEALACAALRLRTGQSKFDAAREIADASLAVCRQRGLTRTRMRILASSVVAEHRAGAPQRARARMAEYIELYGQTDYALPLLREREVSLAVVRSLEMADINQRLHNVVASLIGDLESPLEPTGKPAPDDRAAPTLTARQLEILQRLDGWQDKQIASMLNLSPDGVRYHLKNIFRQLGVNSRLEATRRARALGILPGSNDPQT